MRKNIFTLLAILGIFGFVSCDADRDIETIEPQNQEEVWEDDSLNTNEGFIDEEQRMQENEALIQDEEGLLDDSESQNIERQEGY